MDTPMPAVPTITVTAPQVIPEWMTTGPAWLPVIAALLVALCLLAAFMVGMKLAGR